MGNIMTLKLTRRVPAHSKTASALWCRKDFREMDDKFRNFRASCRNPMDKCYWCRHPFANGEMMALACFDKIGNRTLCQACADALLASEAEAGVPDLQLEVTR